MSTATKNAPVKSFRLSNVTVSIFENDVERDGQRHSYESVKLEKRYRDRSGSWQSTNSFSLDELLRLRLLMDQAITVLASKTHHTESNNH